MGYQEALEARAVDRATCFTAKTITRRLQVLVPQRHLRRQARPSTRPRVASRSHGRRQLWRGQQRKPANRDCRRKQRHEQPCLTLSQAATWSSNDGTGGLLCNISGLVHMLKATLAHPRRINDSLLLLMPDLVPDQLVWSVYLSSVCCTHTELTTD